MLAVQYGYTRRSATRRLTWKKGWKAKQICTKAQTGRSDLTGDWFQQWVRESNAKLASPKPRRDGRRATWT